MKTKYVKEWVRMYTNGLWQFVAKTFDGDYIETKLDITDYKCKKCFERIKEKNPKLDNYKDFCREYREGLRDYTDYLERNERSYRRYWGKRA